MSKRFTYELYAKDGLTAKLRKIGNVSDSTYNKLVGGQRRFNQRMQRGSEIAGTMKSRLTGMIGTYLTLGVGIMGARNSLKKWDTQVQAEAQVMQGITSTNMAAGRSFDQLTQAASNLQQKTLFGDETILQGVTAQMLTFTNVTGQAFDRAQKAALDVTSRLYGAKASGESLRATSIMLGKALNDPVSNLGALSRSGIQFNEEQEAMIKNLWKAGETAKAQSILLAELEKQYGGSAEAAAQVGMGAWQQFMNRIGDIQERFGPFLNQILKGLMTLFDWVQRNARVIGLISLAVLGALAAYKTMMIVTKTWTAIQWALNAAMNANPLGIIITLIGALIAAVIYAWYKFEGFRGVIFGLWEAFKSVFTGIKDLVKSVMGGVGELILGALTFDMDRIRSGLSKLGEGFSNYGKGIVEAYRKGNEAGRKFKPAVPDLLKGMAPGDEKENRNGAGTGLIGNVQGLNAGMAADTEVSSGINGITAGGKKQTNITVNLGKLQDQIVIHAQGIQETAEEIEDMVTEALLKVLNSANKIATQ